MPNTAPWQRVVGLIAEGSDAGEVATAATKAASTGLVLGQDDATLSHTFWLLTQVVLAAREPNFAEALADAGLNTSAEPAVFDIVCAFSDAIDKHTHAQGERTDVGEMAQLAATESLTALLGSRSASLFETTASEVKDALHGLSTKLGFATLAHDFFARFTQRFLTYHLGRELSNHVGGNGRFADATDHNDFINQLDVHCREVAGIVTKYAGDWYSKANFESGITPEKARRFANHALKKLQKELKRREVLDGE